jgi:hypothetical protein
MPLPPVEKGFVKIKNQISMQNGDVAKTNDPLGIFLEFFPIDMV